MTTSTKRKSQFDGLATMARFLIVLGLAILVIGILWPFHARIGLGRLPGDIVIKRDNVMFYFPLVTSLLLSLLLSLVFCVVRQVRQFVRDDNRIDGRGAIEGEGLVDRFL